MTGADNTTNAQVPTARAIPTTGRGIRTRKDILVAATTVFGSHGFAGTTMLDIANEAGVASGTVYQYFADKTDVFRFLIQDLLEQLHRETRMPADSEGRLIVREAVLRYLQVYRANAALFRAWWEILEPPTEFTEAWVKLHNKSTRELTTVIETGKQHDIIAADVDAETTADLIVAMFERPAYLHIVFGWGEGVSDEEIAAAMARLLGQGFLRRTSGVP